MWVGFSETRTPIAKRASEDKDFDAVEQERPDDSPTRKAVYLPKREWEREGEGYEPARVEAPTVPFETNLPWVNVDPDDEREMKHQIGWLRPVQAALEHRERLQEAKAFLAETQSPDNRLRYFNFAFACMLYNCWRLVDILV